MGTRGIIVPSVLVLNLSREGAVPFRLLRRDTLLAITVRVNPFPPILTVPLLLHLLSVSLYLE